MWARRAACRRSATLTAARHLVVHVRPTTARLTASSSTPTPLTHCSDASTPGK
jgi:hypothetical protein